MNPLSEQHRTRLQKAMKHSYRALKPFRNTRMGLIKEYVGKHYAEDGASRKNLVNVIWQAATIYSMLLAANNPRVLTVPKYARLRAFGTNLGIAINNLLNELHAREPLGEIVLDAFFSVGISKVCLVDGFETEFEDGWWMDPGKPYLGRVSLDNWVHDVTAPEWHKVSFAGDQYKVSLEKLQQSVRADQKVTKNLQPDDFDPRTSEGDEKAEGIGSGEESEEEFRPQVALWDVFLPDAKLIATFPVQRETFGKPVAVRELDDIEGGPYDLLRFYPTPDNIMPTAPAQQLKDMHILINQLWRKLAKQANRQKDIYGYSGEAANDAERARDADDGHMVRLEHPESVHPFKFGGVDPGNLNFAIQCDRMFNQIAGNLDVLGGLGPASGTVGQDRMISESSGKIIAKMQNSVARFVGNVVEKLGWILWNHPTLEIPGVKEIVGTSMTIDATWGPETQREGDFLDYNFELIPYSMEYKSPEDRVNDILSLIQQFYLPIMPVLAEQGAMIDWHRLNTTIADYKNYPELKEIIMFGQRPPETQPNHQAPKPQHTHRTYERINRPQSTREGTANVMSMMMGGNPQQSQQQQL